MSRHFLSAEDKGVDLDDDDDDDDCTIARTKSSNSKQELLDREGWEGLLATTHECHSVPPTPFFTQLHCALLYVGLLHLCV